MKQFLAFRFDERTCTLWRGREPVRLTRKASALLGCLVDAAGEIVSHDTILATVWSGTHVQFENIKVLVREIRQALDDDAHAPSFIRTDPRLGYTFVAPVEDVRTLAPEPPAAAISSIFANHEHDLSRLSALADPFSPDCRVVLVEGERGAGKTSFCEAFVQRVGARAPGRVCYGHAVAQPGAPEPYLPFLDALHHLTRQAPATMPGMLARYAPSWLARLRHWLTDGGTPDVSGGPAEPSRALRELGALLEALADEGPTVIVLDDLQMADMETVDLLRSLAIRYPPLHTVVLATYAPFATTATAAVLRTLAGELRATGRSVPIRMRPLDEQHVRSYLTERFGGGPIETLSRLLHRLAGGNPMTIVATTDALVAEGYIAPSADGWRLQHSARTIEASLTSGILEPVFWRFEQLDAEDRAVLEWAAAIGTEFSPPEVARIAGSETPIRIAWRLQALWERGFIARRGRLRQARPVVYHAYRFHHPVHAELLAARAPVFDQLRAAARLASASYVRQKLG